MKKHLSLACASILIIAIWLGETLLRDWRGLEWLNYFHYSLLIIPCIFIAWLIVIDKKFTPSKHLLKYPILIIGYFLFCIALLAVLISHNEIHNHYNFLKPLTVFLFVIVTFGMNLIISKMENRKLRFYQKVILFFSCFFIPVCSELVTSLIFTQTWILPQNTKLTSFIFSWLNIHGASFFYIEESILHWLKSGGLIVSITLYEGIFILYLQTLPSIVSAKFKC